MIHPFREGNGRAQREFINHLARQAGYRIIWSLVTREQMIRASIQAGLRNYNEMIKLIQSNIVDLNFNQAKMISLEKDITGKKVNFIHAEKGKVYTGPVIGKTDRYIVQTHNNDNQFILHKLQSL